MESKSVDPRPEAAAIERLLQKFWNSGERYGLKDLLTEAYSLGISQGRKEAGTQPAQPLGEVSYLLEKCTCGHAMAAHDFSGPNPKRRYCGQCDCLYWNLAKSPAVTLQSEFERGISQERERCAKIADSKICPSAVLAELYSRKSPLCSTPLPDMSDAVAKTLVYVAAAIRNPDPTEGQ